MVGTLIPYFGITAVLLGFWAIDRYRRQNQFRQPPPNYSSSNGSDWFPSTGIWSADSGPSWSSSGDSTCSIGSDSGGSCDSGGGDGGGGGGGD